MEDQVYCVLDYETFSEADLPKVGGWEYSVHESTDIICAGVRTGTRKSLPKEKTKLWLPGHTNEGFADLWRALKDPSIQMVAHNAGFEQMITRNVLATKHHYSKKDFIQSIPVERWNCTAAMSRAIGIPGSLEGAGSAMRLKVQKDTEGKKLVKELCIPQKRNSVGLHAIKLKSGLWRVTQPERIKRLAEYCVRDVDTEVELFLKLPELTPKEKKFWCLNQRMNFRGFAIDRELVHGALNLISLEAARLDRRTKEITKGQLDSARQRAKVLQFVKKKGLVLPDLRSATVKEFLDNTKVKPGQEGAFELLQIRDSISRSSTAKYAAMEIRTRSDGRSRDNTIWHGAHTGRENGTGFQPLNLFKSKLHKEDLEVGLDLMRRQDFHTIQALYENPMLLFASALRSCIWAEPGSILEVGDFATIEVRVLFWLANEKFGLKQIANGDDLYCHMAGKIYNEDPKEILRLYEAGDKDATFKRQLGKQVVLGAGFGIGVGGEKFQLTAKSYGMDISLDIAQSAVRAYRELYPRVPIFWTNMEKAAIMAVRNPGKRYRLGHVVWEMEGNRLTCKLPNGRKLSYFNASIGLKPTLFGPKPCLQYQGVLSPSKIFGRVHTWGGKLVENAVQGVARDMLYEALLAIEEEGKRLPILAVHDEIIAERKKEQGEVVDNVVRGFFNTMAKVPDWAEGLPVKVGGWSEARYRK